jgi:hypothetical protein
MIKVLLDNAKYLRDTTTVVDMDGSAWIHHFGNLDLHVNSHQIQIRIRIT